MADQVVYIPIAPLSIYIKVRKDPGAVEDNNFSFIFNQKAIKKEHAHLRWRKEQENQKKYVVRTIARSMLSKHIQDHLIYLTWYMKINIFWDLLEWWPIQNRQPLPTYKCSKINRTYQCHFESKGNEKVTCTAALKPSAEKQKNCVVRIIASPMLSKHIQVLLNNLICYMKMNIFLDRLEWRPIQNRGPLPTYKYCKINHTYQFRIFFPLPWKVKLKDGHLYAYSSIAIPNAICVIIYCRSHNPEVSVTVGSCTETDREVKSILKCKEG